MLAILAFVFLFRNRGFGLGTFQSDLFHDPGHDLIRGVGVLFQELLGRFATLTDPITAERIPRTAFLHDAHLAAEIDDFAVAGNPGSIKNIELGLLERRRHFVFDDLHAGAAADDIIPILERADPTYVHAHRSVEF